MFSRLCFLLSCFTISVFAQDNGGDPLNCPVTGEWFVDWDASHECLSQLSQPYPVPGQILPLLTVTDIIQAAGAAWTADNLIEAEGEICVRIMPQLGAGAFGADVFRQYCDPVLTSLREGTTLDAEEHCRLILNLTGFMTTIMSEPAPPQPDGPTAELDYPLEIFALRPFDFKGVLESIVADQFGVSIYDVDNICRARQFVVDAGSTLEELVTNFLEAFVEVVIPRAAEICNSWNDILVALEAFSSGNFSMGPDINIRGYLNDQSDFVARWAGYESREAMCQRLSETRGDSGIPALLDDVAADVVDSILSVLTDAQQCSTIVQEGLDLALMYGPGLDPYALNLQIYQITGTNGTNQLCQVVADAFQPGGTFFFPYGSSEEFNDSRFASYFVERIYMYVTNPFRIIGKSDITRLDVWRDGYVHAAGFLNVLSSNISVDISAVGDIFFRTSDQGTDNTTFSQAERAIRDATPEFLGHSLLTIVVASWIDVPRYENNPDQRNTFQVLIGTDGELTYVFFNYKEIDWKGNFAGIRSIGSGPSTFLVTLDPDDLVTGSNYGESGSWLFEVSDAVREIGRVQCGSSDPCYNGGTCQEDECVCAEGFSGNFCHLDECNNRCLNGASCEQGVCECLAGFDGEMCQNKLTSVECGSTSMTVNVNSRLVPGNASGVHFRTQSCNGVINANTDIITLTTDYNECGTILEEDNTTVTFSNVITYAKPGSEDGTGITRQYHMQVRVECCLKKEEIISGSFKPQLGEVAFSEKGSGNFSLILERFQTDAFNERESETTSVVGKGDDLYFGVYLETVSGLGMFIDSCWATTTQDSNAEPHYSLISSGCPADGTVAINRSPALNREGFSFSAFAFVGDYTEVYIHCSVKVCGTVEAQSFRDAECPSEFDPLTPLRKRRSSSVMSTQTISNGPIHIRRSTSDMATNDLASYNPLAMLLLGMIATLVAMAILMGVVKLVRISSDNNYYQRIPIAESMEGN